MFKLLEIAARNTLRHKRRSALTVATVVVGVAATILAGGLVEGFKKGMGRAIIDANVGHIEIHAKGYMDAGFLKPLDLDIDDPSRVLDVVASQPHVAGATGRIRFEGMASFKGNSVNILGVGVDPEVEFVVFRSILARDGVDLTYMVEGRPFSTETPLDGALLASGLAERIGATVGDPIAIIARTRGGAVNALDVTVEGIFKFDFSILSDALMFITLQNARDLLDFGGGVTEIAVMLDDDRYVEEVLRSLSSNLNGDGMALEVNAWPDFAPDFVRGLGLFSRIADFASIILFAMIAGAIANTMLMAVFERTREIGTMASLGGRRHQIVMLFLLEALVLGLAGTILGGGVGVGLTHLLGATGIHFPPLPAQTVDLILRPEVALGSVVKGALLAVAVSVAAALYPASVAASVRPIEALGHV